MKKINYICFILLFASCTTANVERKESKNPSLEYSKKLQEKIDAENEKQELAFQKRIDQYEQYAGIEEMRARHHFVKDEEGVDVSNLAQNQIQNDNMQSFQNEDSDQERPKYKGPLFYGDAGRSPSLWEESKTGGNDLFRDDRAWLPGDLVTILITEKSDAKGEADTNTKKETTLLGGIAALFGIDSWFADKNPRVKPSTMFSTNSSLEYDAEGKTTRKNTLTAKISAMVMEVLPSGLLRVEGEKIVAVNSEEQIIKISGIVRPKDVNSSNEIDSAKLGNMRVDYYGQGTLQDVQTPGWGTKILTNLWPF